MSCQGMIPNSYIEQQEHLQHHSRGEIYTNTFVICTQTMTSIFHFLRYNIEPLNKHVFYFFIGVKYN